MRWPVLLILLGGLFVACRRSDPATLQALEEYRSGRVEAAISRYRSLLEEAPPRIGAGGGAPLQPRGRLCMRQTGSRMQFPSCSRAAEGGRHRALEGSPLVARFWYNLGNAFYRDREFQRAVEAYKHALRLVPEDLEAKHNLELALEALQEQIAQGWPFG
ncbi:MAG: hypothetical protein KatS3mg115_2139 [Candidatus Poribacteria bacterium]|nr:MAG: hypothetical protein KatS3mg115_2139 [Candidatus Poribacteria bacterium]